MGPGLKNRPDDHAKYISKNFLSSKKKQKLAILASLSPCRYDNDKTGLFSTKNSVINPFPVKRIKESKCKRFRKRAKREKFDPKLDPKMKKNSIHFPMQTLFNNIMEKKCIQFPSFMSEHKLSTSFKTCIYLKENHFHCSLRRPEIHSQHQQGYQGANAKWGTTINLQRTTTALNLVEHLEGWHWKENMKTE